MGNVDWIFQDFDLRGVHNLFSDPDPLISDLRPYFYRNSYMKMYESEATFVLVNTFFQINQNM